MAHKMYNITMIENNEVREIQTLDTMDKEMLKDAEAYIITNEEGTIIDSKKMSKLIKAMTNK